MVNSKKKKNYKLKRRVKRTIAAIMMIMAVVVAAIPVENFGTMQASEDSISLLSANYEFDMGEIYDSDDSNREIWGELYDDSKDYGGYKENSFNSDKVSIVKISGGNTAEYAYEATKDNTSNSTNAIVSGTKNENIASLNISEKEYYGYVMFDEAAINDFRKNIRDDNGSETFSITFDRETASASLTGGSYDVKNADGDVTDTYTFEKIDNVYKFKGVDNYSGSSVKLSDITDTSGNTQEYYKRVSDTDTVTIIENCEASKLEAQKQLVEDYNSDVDEILDIQYKLTNSEEVTSSDLEKWNDFASNFSDDFNNAETLSLSYDDLTKTDGLPNAYNYIITQCYYNGSNTLKNYDLTSGKYNGGTVYFAKLKSDANKEDNQIVDADNSFLALGEVTIVGIASNAFAVNSSYNPQVQSVSIPSSVKFIGKSAFDGCRALENVSIDLSEGCRIIGDRAFADCSKLSNLTIGGEDSKIQLETLGVRAFAGTAITSVSISSYVKTVGAGCFENSKLTSVLFESGSSSNNVEIADYAFYNCPGIANVSFDEANVYTIGKGVFALPINSDDSMRNFTFPNASTAIDGDYVLAGRGNLTKVTFGANLSCVIPAHTLAGCYNLASAVFESGAASYVTYETTDGTPSGTPVYDSYGNIKVLDEQLFSDVMNESFMVEGPEYRNNVNNGPYALARTCSWTAILGYQIDGEWAPVAYKYVDSEEKEHIELGYNGGKYIATIDIDDNGDAVLSSYVQNTQFDVGDDRIAVTIPAKVGGYNIVEIGNDCFGGDVKDKIYKITIADGSVSRIGDNAFEDCKKLEWVYIGNNVSSIGKEAFAGCERLENVEFSQVGKRGIEYLGDDDDAWQAEMTIDENAFNTQSDYLTFHGGIHKGYAPYELAMSEDSAKMTNSGAQICYTSDEPYNLTVMRNRDNGKATLVDYPHYDEIDTINSEYIKEKYEGATHSITEAFEDFYKNGITEPVLEDDEQNIVNASFYVDLPRGIDSIDSASFFNDKAGNSKDFDYLSYQYIFKEENISSSDAKIYVREKITSSIRDDSDRKITKIYSEDGYVSDTQYASDYGIEGVSIGGLFSGNFNESNISISRSVYDNYTSANGTRSVNNGFIGSTLNGHDYQEDYASGNDYLTTITMPTVDMLPNYAFDSCENLLTASFSDELAEINTLPFRDCKNLYSVDLGTSLGGNNSSNSRYTFQNMILYENNGGSYTIKECLEGRGKGGEYLGTAISQNELPDNVTSMEENAFSNCDKLETVDLGGTKIMELPEGSFDGSSSLNAVILPDTIRKIDRGALTGVSGNLVITIPNPNCVISDDAIDGKSTVTIIGVKYLSDGTSLSDCWYSYQQLLNKYPNVYFSDYGSSYTVEFVDKDLKTIPGYQAIVEVKDGVGADLEAKEIPDAPKVDGFDFVTWMCRVGDSVLKGTKAGDEAFINIKEDRTYIPSYVPNPKSVVSDGSVYTLTIVSGKGTTAEVTTATDTLSIEGGTQVTLLADTVKGKTFKNWTIDNNDYSSLIGSPSSELTTFTMPNADVTITANYDGSGSSSGGGNGSGGDGSSSDSTTKYKVTVNYGSGSGEYKAGDVVTISAYAPESSSKVFSKWTSNNSSLGFASVTSSTTTFVMPAADVTVTANYKTRTDDDDDDDSSSSRRPGSTTSSTTTTVTNTPSSSTGTGTSNTATVSNSTTGNGDGSKIYITKNGISNKDVASVSVEGSTDNFIVKITESAEATAQVEEALTNKYGSLDGIAYFPMDISLYDSTGQNKITDTYGLNITVTMPIPDVLIQYGGNARVAAADNGNLQQLTPKFTTIDGIACISFVPPHFSPYVIYVDTNNLIAGQTLDSTPSTGDPIHPKWFAAIGMACISVILFATSDGKKRRDFKTA